MGVESRPLEMALSVILDFRLKPPDGTGAQADRFRESALGHLEVVGDVLPWVVEDPYPYDQAAWDLNNPA